jgi:glutaredoxin
MKKIVILVLIVAAAYWGYMNYGSRLFGAGAFDAQGNPKVLLFTTDACGQPCKDVAVDLQRRNIAFEEVSVMTEEGRSRIGKFGVRQVPFTVIGRRTVLGSDLPMIESALAEVLGIDTLTPAVRDVMKNHFDVMGEPRVVLYGTTTCSYCTKMRAHMDSNKIVYQFMDVKGSSSARREFDVLRGRGYPLVFVGYRRIDGYDAGKVDQAVKDLM